MYLETKYLDSGASILKQFPMPLQLGQERKKRELKELIWNDARVFAADLKDMT